MNIVSWLRALRETSFKSPPYFLFPSNTCFGIALGLTYFYSITEERSNELKMNVYKWPVPSCTVKICTRNFYTYLRVWVNIFINLFWRWAVLLVKKRIFNKHISKQFWKIAVDVYINLMDFERCSLERKLPFKFLSEDTCFHQKRLSLGLFVNQVILVFSTELLIKIGHHKEFQSWRFER